MVCDVYLGLSREGVGDLGRNWLDAGDERIEKNIVQVCFVLNVGVGDMGQKAKPEGCGKGAMRTPFESRRGKPEGCGTLLLECTIF